MTAIRAQFLFAALLLWGGIAHTGFAAASPLIYFPAFMMTVAGLAGFCPGIAFWKRLGLPNDPLPAKPGRRPR